MCESCRVTFDQPKLFKLAFFLPIQKTYIIIIERLLFYLGIQKVLLNFFVAILPDLTVADDFYVDQLCMDLNYFL